MDEYKDYLYARSPGKYEKVDAGDLTEQKAIREKLQCKSFDWFIKEIAPDLVEKYPPLDPPGKQLFLLLNNKINILYVFVKRFCFWSHSVSVKSYILR